MKAANLKMLEFVARKLGKLCDEVVFLGGCTTALFITDPASPDVRYTLDVDCIADVISYTQYHQLEKKLSAQGFKQSIQDDILCRWRYDDMILDVMPTDEKILGFGNRWYKQAIQNSAIHRLTEDLEINVVSAPYFLATKLEAFKTRGNNDFYASHDFEDILSVLDGRNEIVNEVALLGHEIKDYLNDSFAKIIDNKGFLGALPGHFIQYGNLAEDRIDLLLGKMKRIVNQKEDILLS